MKHVEKFLSLSGVLTLVVALSGCVTSFSIDIMLDPLYEFNHVKIVSYIGSGDGTIVAATHRERNLATGMEYIHNMIGDPAHYGWVEMTVPSGTTDKIVCYWAAYHPGPGWEHTVELTIQDTGGQTRTAIASRSI